MLYDIICRLEEDDMGKISIGTFHSWLKQHRAYVRTCTLTI